MAHEEPAEIINSDIGKTTITTYRIRREKEKKSFTLFTETANLMSEKKKK